jgi:hypothetical protein
MPVCRRRMTVAESQHNSGRRRTTGASQGRWREAEAASWAVAFHSHFTHVSLTFGVRCPRGLNVARHCRRSSSQSLRQRGSGGRGSQRTAWTPEDGKRGRSTGKSVSRTGILLSRVGGDRWRQRGRVPETVGKDPVEARGRVSVSVGEDEGGGRRGWVEDGLR